MTDEKPRVIIIPPKPELQQTTAVTKQLRVAAYGGQFEGSRIPTVML
jgi:hypothetical protein